mmetsp:Transcript_122921/g.223367  ORF Transcript_122921/g.223367 Transcript_122921/m.223367 type:complete len:466 (+) Transcript_122921:56-1453(+)
MPRAPTAKGRGRGAGPAAPKAAPIARPSRDYQWKIEQRAYGTGEEKEHREEMRRQEAERRQQAREHGEEVDLGRDADYWRRIAESGSKAPAYRSTASDDRHWPQRGTLNAWPAPTAYNHGHQAPVSNGRSSWQAPVSNGRDWSASAASASNSTRAWDTHDQSASSHWQHDDRWERNTPEGSVAGTNHSGGSPQKDWGTPTSAWNAQADGWSASAAASPRYHEGSTTSREPRSFTPDSKARRQEMRKREAEARRRALEERQALSTPPPAPPPNLQFDFANAGLDSERLQGIIAEAEQRLARHEVEPFAQAIDLSGNNLTDADIADFVSFLQVQGITSEMLCIQGNPLESPQSLVELLGDSRVGLKRDLRELRISSDISKECCWRICEKANRQRPRPPLRLIMIGRPTHDIFTVFRMAVSKYSAKVAGFPGGVSEDEAYLVVQLLEDESEDVSAMGSSDKGQEFRYQ